MLLSAPTTQLGTGWQVPLTSVQCGKHSPQYTPPASLWQARCTSLQAGQLVQSLQPV
jgi:hypothetical protein